ncbi:Tat pathway signal sequence domain protein [Actinopolymorpha pittospori]|uniref:Tat pathway signal sequence domain protein n=1 Tax=Actinopolymorpha pittospori TaxID=648752 RepID=A0A927MX71_9ACTN|nr:Tat pathway signal sequence domain protein [Actinopolymorpha pittospori]MBE1608571.1 hypothetical protein [Actinopolymorpha pittospori]
MTDDLAVDLHWLEPPAGSVPGVTWGMPWQPGALTDPAQASFHVSAASGEQRLVDSWVTARWPDGSIKWTGHAIGRLDQPADGYRLTVGSFAGGSPTGARVSVEHTETTVIVDTGALRLELARRGSQIITALTRSGRLVGANGRLISLIQTTPPDEEAVRVDRVQCTGHVTGIKVERHGDQHAVLRIAGHHEVQSGTASGELPRLPFVLRVYAYAGSPELRLVHSFTWDGDEHRHFLAGLGIRFDVPMVDPLHDRHVRLAGPSGHFLTEAVRGLTGLRRDPGADVRAAQLAGRSCGDPSRWNPEVANRLGRIPAWGDYTLAQLSSDGFTLRKRTEPGHGWVDVGGGNRSAGFAYAGGVSGGIGIGLRDFWQSYPTQLDIRGAASERASLTLWLYSPQANPMDLRFYHDGMGQDDYASQLDGLEVTYEDYEPGFGTPYGIARTHELMLVAYDCTPSAEHLTRHAGLTELQPLLATDPVYLHRVGVFGDWAPVDRSTPVRATLEDRLDQLFAFYAGQREQRRWYGFWHYGDIMHSYDVDRHTWRYDIGGYAWDNSELSPDLWLWQAYLRSGRADVFRFAEALTRHTGEVDVYHLGRWRGLGTRHNVQHWGCSAKQLRISNAGYRRIFYYLTADDRVGELLDELVDSERLLLEVDPNRKVRDDAYLPGAETAMAIGLGTDFGALAAAWLTAWERTGDPVARDKLLNPLRDIGALRFGFLTGQALYDLTTGRFDSSREQIKVSHLNAVFGLVEVCSEVIALADRFDLDIGDFRAAWLQYCRLFLADPQTQQREVGQPLGGRSLIQGHSRLTAYAARALGDRELAARAWAEFNSGDRIGEETFQLQRADSPNMITPADEAPGISTNGAAQFALAAMQNLALIGDQLH